VPILQKGNAVAARDGNACLEKANPFMRWFSVAALLAACHVDTPAGPKLPSAQADALADVPQLDGLAADASADAAAQDGDATGQRGTDIALSACASAVDCDDGKPCTIDGCEPSKGCTHAASTLACDDGNACTIGDACQDGACLPGGVTTCDDGNVCTQDACSPMSACTHVAIAGPCDDGMPCTMADSCQGGSCVAGAGHLFSTTYGSAGGEHGTALAVLADGGFALAGFAISVSLPGGQKTAGAEDFWLVRTDAEGKLLWNQSYGGSNSDLAFSVTAMADGGLAAAGYTVSTDLPGGQKSAGGHDMWVVRTDAAGKLLWNHTYGGSGYDTGYSVIALADGGLMVAGDTGSADLPGGTPTAGGGDFWLVRLHADGKLLWNKTYGGSASDNAERLLALADGGLALAGYTKSTDLPDGRASAGGHDLWLVRTDADGQMLWNQVVGGTEHDLATTVTELTGGDLVLAGATQSTDLPGGQKSKGGSDMWLVRLDAGGKLLWNRTYGGSSDDFAFAVSELADGGLMVAGLTTSTDLPGGKKSAGGGDLWLGRTDASGQLLWNLTYGGTENDDAIAMSVLANGGLVLAGTTDSTDVPGSQKTAGFDDVWLVRSDLWGNADCAKSGVCFAKGQAACDDGNACTADLCDAAHGGCWHQNLGDGLPCGGGKSCAGGACL
jgi:hypothetical protein